MVELTMDADAALLAAMDDDFAWRTTERWSLGGEVVAGTEASLRTARWLAEEMESLDLEAGMSHGSFLEGFPVFGWGELETSVEITHPEHRSLPCRQNCKGDGTGPDGVSAPVVFVGEGHWDDFAANDVRGKIILFHRTEALFWVGLVLMEAKAHGSVGALMDWPEAAPTALKTDNIADSIPAAYIRGVHAQSIGESAAVRRSSRLLPQALPALRRSASVYRWCRTPRGTEALADVEPMRTVANRTLSVLPAASTE